MLLEYFGFLFQRNSVHTARTIMLNDLSLLLHHVSKKNSSKADYNKAIVDDNCLGKRSVQTRLLSARYLKNLYGLDPSLILFRSLRFFWSRDEEGRPLLALLCAVARDNLLLSTAEIILKQSEGTIVSRSVMEEYINNLEPGRFSKATLKSTAQNVNATWTYSGHLQGRRKKVRTKAKASVGPVSYALLLGYLRGKRGESLFQNEYMHILDCSQEYSMELATEASCRGWLRFKRINNIMEVTFPTLLSTEELRWVYEQNR